MKFCENIGRFIKNNQKLIHVDISSMNLGDNIILIKK